MKSQTGEERDMVADKDLWSVVRFPYVDDLIVGGLLVT